ncbi:alpha-glucosidase [Holotrichia oblita]|uniref:Alpha-glucosidase n=1 Tax=Holotrichia oblita TaxID=644536 RepID=A0ACB9SRA9_HOLOL|nr:alpha-glucosidase [Holotrichia oblita]
MENSEDHVTFVERHRRIEQEEEAQEENKPRLTRWQRFYKSRITLLAIITICFTIIVPILLFYFVITRADRTVIPHTCAINPEFRIPCGDGNFTETECRTKRYCCFDFTDEYCYHFLPSKYAYVPGNDNTYYTTNRTEDVFLNTANKRLRLAIQYVNDDKLKIILHYQNYENINRPDSANYDVNLYEDELGFDIIRKETGDVLLTTGLGPLMSSKNYTEWSFYMGETLFGLDELYFSSNETYSKVIYKNRNDHTTIPAFMSYNNGSYHGIVFDIAGPVEFLVLPSRLVSVRVLSDEAISFTMAIGPTPKDVQQQLYDFDLPPRWMLQPHICRNGSGDINSIIEEYRGFSLNNSDVRYATDCLHQNLYYLLYSMNETEREALDSTLDLLTENSRFIMTLYPQVPIENVTRIYTTAEESDLLYTMGIGNETKIHEGVHLGQSVAFLDYAGKTDSIDMWFEEMFNQFNLTDFNITGFSLRDNWPDDEAFIMERVEDLPYLNGVRFGIIIKFKISFAETFLSAMSHAIAWNATTSTQDPHFRRHNNYANGQIEMLKRNLEDVLLLTTSSYTSSTNGAFAQIQNMNTSWVNLRKTIKTGLSHSLFANPFIFIPVCGSTSGYIPDIQDILCSRWYITAATFPIFTISSDLPRRDLTALPTGHNRNIALNALAIRDMLMPYFYTVLSRKEILTRPMFYDFYEDEYTHTLEDQYMLGDAFLVAQPLLRDMFIINVYLPPEAGGFYEFFGGEYFGEELGNVSLSVVVESDWLVFMREGKIVPLQNNNTYTLAIALSPGEMEATGTLFFNTATLQMAANNSTLLLSNLNEVREDILCSNDNSEIPRVVSGARIYGLSQPFFEVSTFDSVDLCSTNDDEVEIDYFISQEL